MQDEADERQPIPDGDSTNGGSGGSPRRAGWLSGLLMGGLVVAAGAGGLALIFATEPTAERDAATKQTAMLVEVTQPAAGSFTPEIVATGTVRPAREIVLRSRVSGRVVERGRDFVPGRRVAQGELVVRMDDADHRSALAQRRAELAQAKADLRVEQGRKRLAQKEYELLDERLSKADESLVLREPQIDSAKAEVEIRRTRVDRARRELERTRITAPFDARLLSREVTVGSEVAAGDALARLAGTQRYWVETTVALDKLRWLDFGQGGAECGAPVAVRDRSAWPEGVTRQGRLCQHMGRVDDATRMARVLVAVDDPLARNGPSGTPALTIGAFVETRIAGRRLHDVVRLAREYVRSDDTVWVMRDGALAIREVDVVLRDARYAYIRDGLAPSEAVVTSSLATVEEGAALRVEGDEGARDDTPSEDPASSGADGRGNRS